MRKVIVVGSTNMDSIIYVDELPVRHQTVLGNSGMVAIGGKGANQAVAASRAGGMVDFVSIIGKDPAGISCLAQLKDSGVRTDKIQYSKEEATGQAAVLVDRNGDNMIAVSPGANSRIDSSTIRAGLADIEIDDVVVFQLEIPLDAVECGLQLADRANARTILNPAPMHPRVKTLLPFTQIITPNQVEAEDLTGYAIGDKREAELAARWMLDSGCQQVVITLGSDGCFVMDHECKAHIPIFDVGKPVDTTGAGDTFNGALAVALCEGGSLVEAARFATAASGLSTKAKSAGASAPERSHIELLLAR